MEAKTKRQKRAETLVLEAMNRAVALAGRKGGDYGHFTEYPLAAVAGLGLVKAKRILNLSTKGGSPNFESLEDSCVDLVNYASFCYAIVRLMKEEAGNG